MSNHRNLRVVVEAVFTVRYYVAFKAAGGMDGGWGWGEGGGGRGLMGVM